MRSVIAFALLLLPQSLLQAQTGPLPFTRRPLTQEEYSRAIYTPGGPLRGDSTLLNHDANLITRAAFQAIGLSTIRPGLAILIDSLDAEPCPARRVKLVAIRGDSIDASEGWEVDLRPESTCLYSGETAVIPLDYGNFIISPFALPGLEVMIDPPVPLPPLAPARQTTYAAPQPQVELEPEVIYPDTIRIRVRGTINIKRSRQIIIWRRP